MIQDLFKAMKVSEEQPKEKEREEASVDRRVSKQYKVSLKSPPEIQKEVHPLGSVDKDKQQMLDDVVAQDIKAIMNMTMLKTRRTYTKEYIPLGSIVTILLKQHQLKNLHFEHIYLNSVNQSSLHKVVFKHNEQKSQIRFYIPTFLRFSLIKLHSEDLKNITHIDNKNNLIIYINVYTKGLPKMLIDKLTRKTKGKDGQEEPKLLFRANRHLFQAKYYTSYNDYLIFMFNPFSEKMIEFEIMKNVMFAPFQQAELILHIRINKKVFKLQKPKTLRIATGAKEVPFEPESPMKRMRSRVSASMQLQKEAQSEEQQEYEQQVDILHFNKIIMEFKLQKPKNVVDSFRFHKSIEFGNYGIMTNEINIHIGTYESPQKKKQLQEEKAQLNIDEEQLQQALHQAQIQDISSLRLSIGLYKHPVTDLCTFFIPLMLAGGLTILLFHLCDHDLVNEAEVLAIILVAYGAFIPEFRDRISMSRSVIFVDIYIVYNMIPAILCALQSIAQSRHKQTYNSYQVISVIMYYISILFLLEVYVLYLYVDNRNFQKYTKEMVHNFDTDIFETQQFEEEQERFLSWFVLKNIKERAFFCERQDPSQRHHSRPRFTRKQTRYSSKIQQDINEQQQKRRVHEQQLAQSMALQIRMSTTNKALHEVKQSEYQQDRERRDHREYLYKTKVIQNQRHIHSFQKIVSWKVMTIGILIIVAILSLTIWLSWNHIYEILTFEDLNKNCIHDEKQEQRLSRVQSIIKKEEKLQKMIQQSWNDPHVPDSYNWWDDNNFLFFHHLAKPDESNKKGADIHSHSSKTQSKKHFKARHHNLRQSQSSEQK